VNKKAVDSSPDRPGLKGRNDPLFVNERAHRRSPISIRLARSEIEQIHARAHSLSANITGVARDLIRTGLAGGDNKALAEIRVLRLPTVR